VDNPIIVALDGLDFDEAVDMADRLMDLVWGFKVNSLFYDGGVDVVNALSEKGRVMLDLKWHDIPNTVTNWAQEAKNQPYIPDIVTVHASGGVDMMKAAVNVLPDKVAAVTVLTSLDAGECTGIYGTYVEGAVGRLARKAADAEVAYIVCSANDLAYECFDRAQQSSMYACAHIPKITPGIRPEWYQKKDDQRRVMTPAQAMEAGATYLVIGRPIVQADNPQDAAKRTFEEIQS